MEPKKPQNIYQFLQELSQKFGERPALYGRNPSSQGDQWYSLSYSDILSASQTLAAKLQLLDLTKNTRVLLAARSRPEYSIGFFAVPMVGGITVPLDTRLTLADQKYIAEFSEAQFILTVDEESFKSAQSLVAQVQHKMQIVRIEEAMTEKLLPIVDLHHSVLDPHEMMMITYTSGTTSQPKGVMLCWNNLYYQVTTLLPLFKEKSDFRMLSILPLHHMFEITAGFLLPLYQGGSVYYANSLIPQQIISFFKEKKIRDVLAVPLFLKSLKKGIEAEIQRSPLKRAWFEATFELAAKIPSKTVRRLLFLPVHKKFGGELRQMISGASALDPRLDHFFETLGVSIFEGYGMTEASPVISTNSKLWKKLGSIGKALPGLEIKLHPETQEVLVKGPSVMLGYYQNTAATKAWLTEDGWLNTGDVAEVDSEGFISLRGRTKDIIVLGSGKKVVTVDIEACYQDLPEIQEFCVLGLESNQGATQGTEVVTVVAVPNPAIPRTEEEIRQILIRASQNLSYYKKPTNFIILNEALPKTSTLKIQKNKVRELILQKRITI